MKIEVLGPNRIQLKVDGFVPEIVIQGKEFIYLAELVEVAKRHYKEVRCEGCDHSRDSHELPGRCVGLFCICPKFREPKVDDAH